MSSETSTKSAHPRGGGGRISLETSASVLKDILLGSTTEVKLRPKKKPSADNGGGQIQVQQQQQQQHRHSLHGVPDQWNTSLYADPYNAVANRQHCRQSLFIPSGRHVLPLLMSSSPQPLGIPHHFDGYIYVDKARTKKNSSGHIKANLKKRIYHPVNGNNQPMSLGLDFFPIGTSTPPRDRKTTTVPYYVGDTLGNSSGGSVSLPYSDQAEDRDSSLEESKEYAVLEDEEVATAGSCCRCECHLPTDEEDDDEGRQGRTAAAKAAPARGVSAPAHAHKPAAAAAAQQRSLSAHEPPPPAEEVRKREKQLERTPTQRKSLLLLEQQTSAAWSGVSGVPGLGLSIPQRPLSSCEREWNGSGGNKLQVLAAKAKRKLTLSDHDSSTSSSASSSSTWSPLSLQSLSNLKKLDLPRITPGIYSGSSHRSSTRSSTSTCSKSKPKQQHSKPPLSGSRSMTINAQVHWSDEHDDEGIKSHGHQLPSAQRKASFSHHRRLSQLAKSEGGGGGGPSSLPTMAFDGTIPRAPIPTPFQVRSGSSTASDDDVDLNYEVLPNDPGKKLASSDGSANDDTFDSTTAAAAEAIPEHYKVLHDRDGDYSYAYDTSLSPAFLIRYNDDNPEGGTSKRRARSASRRISDEENIYEEILEVRKLIREQHSSNSNSKEESASSSFSSSGNNTDSGVGGGRHRRSNSHAVRKFSSDTLDFGPKSLMSAGGGRRFAKDSSNDSFAVSETSADRSSSSSPDQPKFPSSDDRQKCVEESDLLWLKTNKASEMSGSKNGGVPLTMSDEAFSKIIENHHLKVLGQLKLDHQEFVSGGDGKAAEMSTEGGEMEKKSSLSKIRAMRFGFGKPSAGSNNNNNNNSRAMKRCESLDLKLIEEKKRVSKGFFRKYSDVVSKKYLGSGKKQLSAQKEEAEEENCESDNDDDNFHSFRGRQQVLAKL